MMKYIDDCCQCDAQIEHNILDVQQQQASMIVNKICMKILDQIGVEQNEKQIQYICNLLQVINDIYERNSTNITIIHERVLYQLITEIHKFVNLDEDLNQQLQLLFQNIFQKQFKLVCGLIFTAFNNEYLPSCELLSVLLQQATIKNQQNEYILGLLITQLFVKLKLEISNFQIMKGQQLHQYKIQLTISPENLHHDVLVDFIEKNAIQQVENSSQQQQQKLDSENTFDMSQLFTNILAIEWNDIIKTLNLFRLFIQLICKQNCQTNECKQTQDYFIITYQDKQFHLITFLLYIFKKHQIQYEDYIVLISYLISLDINISQQISTPLIGQIMQNINLDQQCKILSLFSEQLQNIKIIDIKNINIQIEQQINFLLDQYNSNNFIRKQLNTYNSYLILKDYINLNIDTLNVLQSCDCYEQKNNDMFLFQQLINISNHYNYNIIKNIIIENSQWNDQIENLLSFILTNKINIYIFANQLQMIEDQYTLHVMLVSCYKLIQMKTINNQNQNIQIYMYLTNIILKKLQQVEYNSKIQYIDYVKQLQLFINVCFMYDNYVGNQQIKLLINLFQNIDCGGNYEQYKSYQLINHFISIIIKLINYSISFQTTLKEEKISQLLIFFGLFQKQLQLIKNQNNNPEVVQFIQMNFNGKLMTQLEVSFVKLLLKGLCTIASSHSEKNQIQLIVKCMCTINQIQILFNQVADQNHNFIDQYKQYIQISGTLDQVLNNGLQKHNIFTLLNQVHKNSTNKQNSIKIAINIILNLFVPLVRQVQFLPETQFDILSEQLLTFVKQIQFSDDLTEYLQQNKFELSSYAINNQQKLVLLKICTEYIQILEQGISYNNKNVNQIGFLHYLFEKQKICSQDHFLNTITIKETIYQRIQEIGYIQYIVQLPNQNKEEILNFDENINFYHHFQPINPKHAVHIVISQIVSFLYGIIDLLSITEISNLDEHLILNTDMNYIITNYFGSNLLIQNYLTLFYEVFQFCNYKTSDLLYCMITIQQLINDQKHILYNNTQIKYTELCCSQLEQLANFINQNKFVEEKYKQGDRDIIKMIQNQQLQNTIINAQNIKTKETIIEDLTNFLQTSSYGECVMKIYTFGCQLQLLQQCQVTSDKVVQYSQFLTTLFKYFLSFKCSSLDSTCIQKYIIKLYENRSSDLLNLIAESDTNIKEFLTSQNKSYIEFTNHCHQIAYQICKKSNPYYIFGDYCQAICKLCKVSKNIIQQQEKMFFIEQIVLQINFESGDISQELNCLFIKSLSYLFDNVQLINTEKQYSTEQEIINERQQENKQLNDYQNQIIDYLDTIQNILHKLNKCDENNLLVKLHLQQYQNLQKTLFKLYQSFCNNENISVIFLIQSNANKHIQQVENKIDTYMFDIQYSILTKFKNFQSSAILIEQKQNESIQISQQIQENIHEPNYLMQQIFQNSKIFPFPQKYNKMVSLLLSDEQMQILSILCKCTKNAEMDMMSLTIYNILQFYDKVVISQIQQFNIKQTKQQSSLLQLLQCLIKYEIDKTTEQEKLLRENSMATKLITYYLKQQDDLEFLKQLVTPILAIILQDSKQFPFIQQLQSNTEKQLIFKQYNNCEIDPSKMQQYLQDFIIPERLDAMVQQCIQYNLTYITQIAQKTVNFLFLNIDIIPKSVFEVASLLKQKIYQKYGENIVVLRTVMSGFFFLRLLCPAIISPDNSFFNILKQSNNDYLLANYLLKDPELKFIKLSSAIDGIDRRKLIIIAKILQCLANGVYFGNKEQYMEPLNKFIENNGNIRNIYLDVLARGEYEQYKNSLKQLQNEQQIKSYTYDELFINNQNNEDQYINYSQIQSIIPIQWEANNNNYLKNISNQQTNFSNKTTISQYSETNIIECQHSIITLHDLINKNKQLYIQNVQQQITNTSIIQNIQEIFDQLGSLDDNFKKLFKYISQKVIVPKTEYTFENGSAAYQKHINLNRLQFRNTQIFQKLDSSDIFYQQGESKTFKPIFYFITSQILQIHEVQCYQLCNYIFLILLPYMATQFEIVIDLTNSNLLQQLVAFNIIIQMHLLFQSEIKKHLLHIYLLNPNSDIKIILQQTLFSSEYIEQLKNRVTLIDSLQKLMIIAPESDLALPLKTKLFTQTLTNFQINIQINKDPNILFAFNNQGILLLQQQTIKDKEVIVLQDLIQYDDIIAERDSKTQSIVLIIQNQKINKFYSISSSNIHELNKLLVKGIQEQISLEKFGLEENQQIKKIIKIQTTEKNQISIEQLLQKMQYRSVQRTYTNENNNQKINIIKYNFLNQQFNNIPSQVNYVYLLTLYLLKFIGQKENIKQNQLNNFNFIVASLSQRQDSSKNTQKSLNTNSDIVSHCIYLIQNQLPQIIHPLIVSILNILESNIQQQNACKLISRFFISRVDCKKQLNNFFNNLENNQQIEIITRLIQIACQQHINQYQIFQIIYLFVVDYDYQLIINILNNTIYCQKQDHILKKFLNLFDQQQKPIPSVILGYCIINLFNILFDCDYTQIKQIDGVQQCLNDGKLNYTLELELKFAEIKFQKNKQELKQELIEIIKYIPDNYVQLLSNDVQILHNILKSLLNKDIMLQSNLIQLLCLDIQPNYQTLLYILYKILSYDEIDFDFQLQLVQLLNQMLNQQFIQNSKFLIFKIFANLLNLFKKYYYSSINDKIEFESVLIQTIIEFLKSLNLVCENDYNQYQFDFYIHMIELFFAINDDYCIDQTNQLNMQLIHQIVNNLNSLTDICNIQNKDQISTININTQLHRCQNDVSNNDVNNQPSNKYPYNKQANKYQNYLKQNQQYNTHNQILRQLYILMYQNKQKTQFVFNLQYIKQIQGIENIFYVFQQQDNNIIESNAYNLKYLLQISLLKNNLGLSERIIKLLKQSNQFYQSHFNLRNLIEIKLKQKLDNTFKRQLIQLLTIQDDNKTCGNKKQHANDLELNNSISTQQRDKHNDLYVISDNVRSQDTLNYYEKEDEINYNLLQYYDKKDVLLILIEYIEQNIIL